MKYRTIVADPPWDHSDGTGVNFSDGARATHLPYSTMTNSEISALPVGGVADSRSHLYLWTTTRHLEAGFSVARSWGFGVSAVLVWCKPQRGWNVGGTFASNVEFVLFASKDVGAKQAINLGAWLREQRQGRGLTQKDVARHWPSKTGRITGCVANWELGLNAPTLDQWQDLKRIIRFGDEKDAEVAAINHSKGEPLSTGSSPTRWFTWPRGAHSAKPEAFFDLVESVSPGPYLELFARRQRLGWDTYGDEALNHVELVS